MKGGIAIEFTPLNEYKNMELRLETNSDIYGDTREPLLRGTRRFTVYDVIDAVLSEITWSGDISRGRGAQVGDDG